jgi:PKD repeat protein
VSDPTGAVSGIENSDGSVATQYAYSDPALIANNAAVTFYPQFGTPPPTGGAGELLGVVTDAGTSAPIAGATISAVAYTGGAVFTYTTDMSGTYSAPLCADWYTTSAEAVGYNPVLDVNVTVLGGAQTVQDYALTPICIACSNVDFSWTPITPTVGELVTFTGVASGTQPITYTWDFGDGDSGSGAVFAHSFTDTGTFTVTLTVDNCAGIPVIKEYVIMVTPATWEIYLPITLRH